MPDKGRSTIKQRIKTVSFLAETKRAVESI
jgi:hypothetical protein